MILSAHTNELEIQGSINKCNCHSISDRLLYFSICESNYPYNKYKCSYLYSRSKKYLSNSVNITAFYNIGYISLVHSKSKSTSVSLCFDSGNINFIIKQILE
jgi:hypothetical protein